MRVEVDRLVALDAEKRSVQLKLQELQTEQNKASKELGPLMGQLKKEADAGKKAELEKKVESLKARPSGV
jgi:seryl-tRNA synthetase